jgi:hypothetical protein
MITGLGMPLPLRDEGASLKQALADDTRARLRSACADVVNMLFDSAALADDAQRHARTLLWLRTLRERGAAIIEALQTDLARSGGVSRTPDGCELHDLLRHHFAVLDPQPDELALLATVFRQRLLQAYPAIDPNRRGNDVDAATERIVARLRMGARDAALARTRRRWTRSRNTGHPGGSGSVCRASPQYLAFRRADSGRIDDAADRGGSAGAGIDAGYPDYPGRRDDTHRNHDRPERGEDGTTRGSRKRCHR